MRPVLILLAAALAVPVLLALLLLGDGLLNGQRLFYGLLGRERAERACAAVLADKLRAAGFQPSDLVFGDRPDLSVSTATGTSLKSTFTFQDGAAGTRVDGILACVVHGPAVTVEFRTRTAPVRAT